MSQEQQNTRAAVTGSRAAAPDPAGWGQGQDPHPNLPWPGQQGTDVPEWGKGEHYRPGRRNISTNQLPHIPHPPGTDLRIPKPLPPVFQESCLETGHAERGVGELLNSAPKRHHPAATVKLAGIFGFKPLSCKPVLGNVRTQYLRRVLNPTL